MKTKNSISCIKFDVKSFLLLGEPIVSRVVIVIVSVSDGRAETLLDPAK